MKVRTVLAMGAVVAGTLACCGAIDLDEKLHAFADRMEMYQGFRLSPGFGPGPEIGTGYSGGFDDAGALGQTEFGPCVGRIADTADHPMVLTDDFDDLRIEAHADQDISLVIKGPDKLRCNDDASGLNPAIQDAWPAGSYEIFVGSKTPGNHLYEIRIIENPG